MMPVYERWPVDEAKDTNQAKHSYTHTQERPTLVPMKQNCRYINRNMYEYTHRSMLFCPFYTIWHYSNMLRSQKYGIN